MNLLERCFEGDRNIPVRLKRVAENLEIAKNHIEKADRNINAAKLMLDNKFFDWAITCAYYAMYHATMASLWLIGFDARSHECAITAFEAFYIQEKKVGEKYLSYYKKAHKLSRKLIDTLEKAKTERIKASYGLGEITSNEASDIYADAIDFVGSVRSI